MDQCGDNLSELDFEDSAPTFKFGLMTWREALRSSKKTVTPPHYGRDVPHLDDTTMRRFDPANPRFGAYEGNGRQRDQHLTSVVQA